MTFRRAEGEQTRRADFLPMTFDAEAGTVTAVFATETPVPRYWGTEVLQCTDDAVDMSHLVGAPLLDSHNSLSVTAILGRVESARIKGRKLIGTLRFSDSPEGQAAKAKIAEGMLRAVSVGYSILRHREKIDDDGKAEITVTKWRPHEVSLAPIGADPNARVRSKEFSHMDEDDIETINTPPEPAERPRRRGDGETARARRQRQLDSLRENAVRCGMSTADADEIVDDARSVDEAREAVFDWLARRNGPRTAPNHNIGFSDGREGQASTEAIVAELAGRMGGSAPQGERPFAGVRMSEIGRRYYDGIGVSTRSLDDGRIADMMIGRYEVRGAHATSDFPSLLIEAGHRALQERFAETPTVLKALSRSRSVGDFRAHTIIRPGEAPALEKLTEDGEITFGTTGSMESEFSVESYARAFALSRKAIVNDDLGAFADFNVAFAQSATAREAMEFFKLLSSNSFAGATLKDGNPLFHASRNNVAQTPGELDVPALAVARHAMRTHKNVNGVGLAGVTPSVLVVGPALETAGEKLLAALAATKTDDVNPFAGRLKLLVENQYEGAGWWLFGEPTSRPAFTHGYLSGREGPQVRSDEVLLKPGMIFVCELDFGCAVLDWRSAYFNPGAAE
ncbi:hypothetical protein C7T96_04000 [Nitratireductor sp. StC3]|nr:hypothetical protein C7T96_04000 [Nitratireductor sp. StC3]